MSNSNDSDDKRHTDSISYKESSMNDSSDNDDKKYIDHIYYEIGQRIKKARLMRGFTQEDLAKKKLECQNSKNKDTSKLTLTL